MGKQLEIKTRPNPDYPELTVKHINSREYMQPKLGADGKILTGIDENAYDILSIEDPEEKAAKIKKTKTEREFLERILGVDLRPESDYWNKFYIMIEDGMKLDEDNAFDRLRLHFLVANVYVAPSLEEAENDQQYARCVFYLFSKEEETSKSVKKQKAFNKATAELAKLEENGTRLKIVAAYILGYDPKSDLNEEEAYIKLSEYLNDDDDQKKLKKAKAFTDVCSKDNTELMTKIVLDKAIATHTISVRGGVHKKGDFVLGNNYDETLEFLADPANSKDLASLQKEVARKKK
jgi:hypothetical protein